MRLRILFSTGMLISAAFLPLTLRGESVPQQEASASDAEVKHAPFYVMWNWNRRRTSNERRTTPLRLVSAGQTKTVQVANAERVNLPDRQAGVQTNERETVHIYLPVIDQDDIQENHKRIADEVLRAMPEQCRDTLTDFFVRYDNPGNRGLAGKNTLVVSGNLPDEEFRALLIHELGHVFDLSHDIGCLHGTPKSGRTPFRDGQDVTYRNDPSYAFYQISWTSEKTKKSGSADTDFVTGYAAWDAYEDFAESLVYFLLQNGEFAQRAAENAQIAQKYAWFQRYLFPQNPEIAVGRHEWTGRPPWDSTKLAYEWQPGLTVAQQ